MAGLSSDAPSGRMYLRGSALFHSKILALLLSVGVVACSQSSTAGAQAMSPAAFRDEIANQISRQHADLCFAKPDDFTLRIGRSAVACDEMVMSTAYLYRQYESDPAHASAYISSLVAMALDGLASLGSGAFVPDSERLVVVVRPSAYASFLRQSELDAGGVWRPFLGDLIAVLAQKDGEQFRSIASTDLASLQLTEAAAWQLALANVQKQIGPLERTANEQGAELIAGESGLAPSYLLLPGTCKSGGPNFDVFVVARDAIFYADQRTPTATSMLASYVAELVQSGEAYSRNLISCIDGRWNASAFNGVDAWLPVGERN